MFKFRFFDQDDAPNENLTNVTSKQNQEELEAKIIVPDIDILNKMASTNSINIFRVKDVEIKYCNTNTVAIKNVDITHSDLLTGKYEGGLKIWECTYDLVNYLHDSGLDFKNKKVLDLGCGAGIVGIFALLNGSKLSFQDFNEDVVCNFTVPNILLNVDYDKLKKDCEFVVGDWNSFLILAERNFTEEQKRFDLILTSETIYNPDNYSIICKLFKTMLKPTGVVYLAAKIHYFGVGGGIRQFEDFLKRENVFDFSTCWMYTEGLHREILKITYKNVT